MNLFKNLIAGMALLLLAGCGDTPTSPGMVASDAPAEAAKFRHADLLPSAQKTAGKNGSDTGLIVKLKPQRLMERYKIMERYKLVERYRLMERYTYDYVFDGVAITTATEHLDELLAAFSTDPDIEWFEPDFTVSGRPFSLGYQSEPGDGELVPWSLERIGAVHQEKVDGQDDVILFVVDTGIEHDDLNVKEDFDFGLMEESDGVDPDGHGTHIAGIAAAELNGKGLAGVAPGAVVYNLKVFGHETQAMMDSEEFDLSTALAAVEYITRFKQQNQHIPVVANLAFGARVGPEYTSLDEAIVASTAIGVTYVVSAGNDGAPAEDYTPAHTREAITVGAYDPASQFAIFSNHGPVVDILAPGVDILSLKAGEKKDSRNYALMSGTSMAAAHVSGAVARFLALNPQATPAQIDAALKDSGRDWVSGAPEGTTGLSVYVGESHLDGASGGSGLLEASVAPFRDYAVFSGSGIKLRGLARIAAPGENASILSNGSIELDNPASRVAGFGYYKGGIDLDLAPVVFQPPVNALGMPGFWETADVVVVEEFEPENHIRAATRWVDGTWEIQGTHHLEAGEVVYIDGNLKTEGPTRITGTGIMIVAGSVEIKHGFVTDGPVGLYAKGNFKVVTKTGARVALQGAIYGDSVVLENDLDFVGQITALKTFEIKEDFELNMTYVRVPEHLVRPIWQ